MAYVPFDTGGLPQVSVSKIETFVKCPLSFKLGYIDKDRVRSEQTSEQSFGVAIHECNESVFRWIMAEEFTGRIPDEIVLQCFRDAFFKEVGAGELGLYNDGLNMVRRYFRGLDYVDYQNVMGIERRFVLKFGDFAVVGVMDRVDRDGDDGIVVCDYKTNKQLYSDEEVEDSLQASVYLLAAKTLWPWAKKLSFRFEMLRHDISQPAKRVPDDILAIEQYLVGVYNKMISAKSFPAKPNFFCPWCGQKSRCDTYKKLMELPVGKREPIVADPEADLELISAEREKLSAAESVTKKEKQKFDNIIKRFIHDSVEQKLVTNGKVYTIFSKESVEYDTAATMKVLSRYLRPGFDQEKFMSIDDAKLKLFLEENVPMRAQRAMIMAELGACSKKNRVGAEYINSVSIDGGRRAKKSKA